MGAKTKGGLQSSAIRMPCFWIVRAVFGFSALLKWEGNYSLPRNNEMTRGWSCGYLQKLLCCCLKQAPAEAGTMPTKGTCQGKPSDVRSLPSTKPLPLRQRWGLGLDREGVWAWLLVCMVLGKQGVQSYKEISATGRWIGNFTFINWPTVMTHSATLGWRFLV